MDNASSILEIVYRVKDEATAKAKEIGDALDNNTKQAINMGQAFQVAGGIFLGVGAVGVGVMKMLVDAAQQHQVAMASVDTTLKNVSQTIATHTVLVGGNSTSVKANKAAIDDHIRSLKEQKLQYETMGGAHKSEIDSINNEIKAQELLKLRADDVTISKGHLVTVTDGAIGSFTMLKNTADQLGDAYLRLGFADHDTELAFAQDLRVTKDVTDAKTMLSVSADLARLKNISLTDATTAMTRAYEGSTKILKSMGIEVDKGAKGMDVLNAVQKASAGQAEAYSHTYQGAMDVLSVSVEKLKSSLGDRLLPMFSAFVNSIAGMVSNLNQLSPTVVNTAAKIIGFGTAFSITAGVILSAMGNITNVLNTVENLGWQTTAIIAILMAVVTIGDLLYTNWNKIAPLFKSITPYIKEAADRFNELRLEITERLLIAFHDIETTIKKINDIYKEHTAIINSVALMIGGFFIPTIVILGLKAIWTGLVMGANLITAIADLAVASITTSITMTRTIIMSTIEFGMQGWKTMGMILVWITQNIILRSGMLITTLAIQGATIASTAFGVVMAFITSPIGLVVIAIAGIIAIGYLLITHWKQVQSQGLLLAGMLGAAFGSMGGVIKGVVSSIISDVRGMVNSIIDAINGMIKGVDSVASKIHTPSIGLIPHFASGVNNFGGGMALVGENGPELVNLPQGSSVIPNNQVNKYTTNSPQITLGPVYVNNQGDIDNIVRQLTHAMKYDTSY